MTRGLALSYRNILPISSYGGVVRSHVVRKIRFLEKWRKSTYPPSADGPLNFCATLRSAQLSLATMLTLGWTWTWAWRVSD